MTSKTHSEPCIQEDNVKEIKDDIKALQRTINGNGDGKGMKTDLALVVQRTEGLKEFLDKMENRSGARISRIIAIVAIIVTLLLGIVNFFNNKQNNRHYATEISNTKPQ